MLCTNCSRINKIENLCGKKTCLDIMGKKGSRIRQNDGVVATHTGNDEFAIFFSGKRADMEYRPSETESLCERVTSSMNKSVFPIAFPDPLGNPKISIGYAVVIHESLMREERLLNKVIEDAKTMSRFHEFKRVMR